MTAHPFAYAADRQARALFFTGRVFGPNIVTVTDVLRAVSAEFAVPVGELVSARRDRPVAHVRQIVMCLAAELTPTSLTTIGRRLGGRDHTTVIHGRRAVQRRMAEDPELAARVRRLRRQLAPPEPPHLGEVQLDFLPGPLFDFPCGGANSQPAAGAEARG